MENSGIVPSKGLFSIWTSRILTLLTSQSSFTPSKAPGPRPGPRGFLGIPLVGPLLGIIKTTSLCCRRSRWPSEFTYENDLFFPHCSQGDTGPDISEFFWQQNGSRKCRRRRIFFSGGGFRDLCFFFRRPYIGATFFSLQQYGSRKYRDFSLLSSEPLAKRLYIRKWPFFFSGRHSG